LLPGTKGCNWPIATGDDGQLPAKREQAEESEKKGPKGGVIFISEHLNGLKGLLSLD